MMLYWLKKTSLLVFLFGSLHGISQRPVYDMKLHLDTFTHTLSVDAVISIPDYLVGTKDTLWFQIVANAYSNTYNEFSEELLRRNETSFYFYKDSQLSALKDINITSNGKPLTYYYHEKSNEFIGILAGKSRQFTFSYRLRLPKLIDGVGYKNGNYWLRNFYPQLVVYDGSWQFNHHLFNMDDLVYASDVNVQMDIQGRYLYTNGQRDDTGATTRITSNKMKNLAILLFKKPWESERGHFLANGRTIPFEIIFANTSYDHAEVIGEKLKNIINSLQSHLGEYPYESLTLFLGSKNCYKSDGLAECIKGNGSKDQLYADLTRIMADIWLTDKSKINTFRYPWLSKGLATYYADLLHHQMKIPMDRNTEFDHPGNEVLYTQSRLRQRTPLGKTNLILGSNNSYTQYFYHPAALYQYKQTLTSTSILDEVIKEVATSTNVLTPEVLAQELEQKSQKACKEAIFDYIYKAGHTDYSIQSIQKESNNLILEISNTGDLALPVPVTLIYTDGSEVTVVADGIAQSKNISIVYDQYKSLKQLSLDKQGVLPEIQRSDNHFFVSKNSSRRPFSIKGFATPQNSQANILRLTGLIGYNDNDGMMAGFGISNAAFGEPQ
ncbi:MAG: hypothetical protein WAU01_01155, partial [Saprospiraceae bacterium]